jgi:arsenite methyltransferase
MQIYQFNRRSKMSEDTAQSEKVRSAVRKHYGQIAREFDGAETSCCGPSSCCGDAQPNISTVQLLYEAPEVDELPTDVTGLSLGCGDPVTLASLQPGQTVLDLGSGGGIDCFLAAKRVGSAGSVIGVDMTADMISRARANARKLGAENVEFRLGEIEHLPVADATVDVVISNCVINLSPDKEQVFRETFRVLRPGGRLAVSDIVTRVELPPEVRENLGAWAECVSGALVDKEYVAAIEKAGFKDVAIAEKHLEDAVIADGADQLGVDIDPDAARSIVYSAAVTAIKPGA